MASILLVDDSIDTCRPLARLLQYMGHTVQYATSGAEALECLHAGRPELMLLDVSMPEMDGLELLQRLREEPDLSSLPVVMYTALSDETRRNRAMELGALDYLIKGQTHLGELQAKIKQYMIQ
jgi:CheY-like chemotaxis protein